MRGGGYLVVLAGVAVLAAGCGTQRAQAVDVAAAAASTASQSARVTVTTAMRTQGMSVSFTETGVFDFAHSRGVLRMSGPAGMASEELLVPPHTYLKLPGRTHGLLPRGKVWVAVGSAATGGLGTALLGPIRRHGPGRPADRADRGLEPRQQPGCRDRSRSPGYAPAAGCRPRESRGQGPRQPACGFRAFAASLGAATIPVDVWVDQRSRVRWVRWSPRLPGGMGAPAGARFTQTADFYDFGVPVRVSAPPAGQVASLSHLGGRDTSSSVITSTSRPARPPRASGTLSPAQAAAAGEVVRAFWLALGRHDTQAAAQTVLPAQRACFRAMMVGPHFTVRSLAISSVQPDGNARATVRFTVKAQVTLAGQKIPVLPQGPGRVQWLIATEAGGHWYVDLGRSNSLAFGPACG